MNLDKPAYDLIPDGVNARATNFRPRYATIRELIQLSEADLLKIRNCGRRTVGVIRLYLEQHGLSLRGECPHKHTFGKDCDINDDCDSCKMWKQCATEHRQNHRPPSEHYWELP